MPEEPAGARFPLRVDEALLAEDLAHATQAGRAAIAAELGRLRRDGVPIARLYRCQPDHRDGTDLGGCVKIYIPAPDGPWGAVFAGDQVAGEATLVLVAVGRRHPPQPWAPSVYHVAHQRLHS
jgi:hypothetical protein